MAQPNAPYPTGGDYEIHRAAHDAHSLHSETDKKDAETRAVVNELHPELHSEEVDHAYLNAGKWTKLYRGVLWQMVMFGLLSFVGPAMNDGIGNLGGGGLSTPYLANLASCLNYSFSAGTALFGGPLINKIGIKYSALFCGIFMFLNGSAYYCNVKYKLDAYLLAARAFGGITSAFLYVAESTAMLSYPYADERGRYLGIWASMRNSGAIVGGVINFANNANSATAGGVAVSTYLIFMAFELTGPIWALLLSQTHRVRRRDGTHVPTTKTVSWKAEFIALAKHLKSRRVILMFFPAFYSFFTGGVYGTYLSLHFSVRARSLSTIIYPIFSIVLVLLFGLILDNKRWTPRTRGLIAIAFWAIPQAGCYIWTGIEYTRFAADGKNIAFDYAYTGAGSTPSRWAEAYLPYLIVSSMTYPMQMSVYWVLGTFSTDVKSASRTGGLFRSFETLGQAISYGINANTGDKRIPFYIICGIYCIAVPSMYLLVRMIPDTPSEVDDVVQSEQLAVMEAKATAAQTQQ